MTAAELRPYVFVDGIEVKLDGPVMNVGAKLRNYGKIPARGARVQMDAYLAPLLDRLRPNVLTVDKLGFPSIAPGAYRTGFAYPVLTEAEKESWENGRLVLIIRLRYWYRGLRTYAERADFMHDAESIASERPYIISTDFRRLQDEERKREPDLLEQLAGKGDEKPDHGSGPA